jgi:FkbM family methyltransferase
LGLANFVNGFGRTPLVGPVLRRYAHRYRDGSVVTIACGLAAGYRWKRYHRYVNGYWIGQYELPIQHALRRLIRPGDIVFDIGANAGFFTLIAARLTGPSGRCVAFDPSPDNYQSVREQLELNDLNTYCSARQEAIGSTTGTASFSFAKPGSPQGHLGDAGNGEQSITVRVVTLDSLRDELGTPNFIKLDVEGAEVGVLDGAADLLRAAAKPTWLIELHGPECERGVRERLSAAGYSFFDLDDQPIPTATPLPHHVVARPH